MPDKNELIRNLARIHCRTCYIHNCPELYGVNYYCERSLQIAEANLKTLTEYLKPHLKNWSCDNHSGQIIPDDIWQNLIS